MALPGNPTFRQGYVSPTTDSTSWNPFNNVSVPAGSLAVFFVSIDQAATISVSGSDTAWSLLYSATRSSAVRGNCYYWFNNTGGAVNKSFTLTAASAQQFSGILYIIPRTTSGTWLRISATTSNNLSANPNPPNHDAGAVRDHLWIAAVHSNDTGVATAPPTGYSNLTTQNAGGSNGVSTYSAERTQLNTQQEDPSAFTQSVSRSFVAATVAIWEYTPVVADLAGAVTGSGTVASDLTVTGSSGLSGAVSGSVSTNGVLSLSVPVAGAVTGAAAVGAGLAKTARLAGAVAAEAVALATFPGGGTVAGSASAAATVSGALGVAKAIAGVLTATSTVSGAVTAAVDLRGAAGGPAAVIGTLKTTKPLAAAASASVAVSGAFTGTGALAGAVAVSSAASGAVSKVATLRSDTTIEATGLANIVLTKPLGGSAPTSVIVSASLLGGVVAGNLVLSYIVLGIEAQVSAPELIAEAETKTVEVTVIGLTAQAA